MGFVFRLLQPLSVAQGRYDTGEQHGYFHHNLDESFGCS